MIAITAGPMRKSTASTALAAWAFCGIVCLGGAFCAVAVAPQDEHTVAAIFPPWWSRPESLVAAGLTGEILRTGRYAPVLIVHSDDPRLSSRLRSVGALLVIPTFGLGGCLSPPPQGRPT